MWTEMGYGGISQKTDEGHIKNFVAGAPEPEKDIIAKFIYGWLNDGID